MRGRKKKWWRRIWDATEVYELDREEGQVTVKPLKKPISGKSARRLLGSHKQAECRYWLDFCGPEAPKFNARRKYFFLAEARIDGDTLNTSVYRAHG